MSLKTLVYRRRSWRSDHFHVLICAPVFTLSFLSLVVRTADSAVDLTSEKKKVAQHLQQRLHVLRHDAQGTEIEASVCPLSDQAAVTHTHTLQLRSSLLDSAPLGGTAGATCSTHGHPAHDFSCGPQRDTIFMCQDQIAAGMSPFFPSSAARNDEGSSFIHTPQLPLERKAGDSSPLSLAANPLLLNTIRDPLARRVVSLTAAFEHGESTPAECFETIAGDFDGQVLSFGILQWNLGSCSLQPLLRAFRERDPQRFQHIMQDGARFMERLLAAPCDEGVRLARQELLTRRGQVREHWLARFRALGRTQVFQEVQLQFLLPYVRKAYRLAEEFGFHSERAIALFFDIVIQNGSIPTSVRTQYEQDLQEAERHLGRTLSEVDRMELLARRQAEAANPKWVDTVRKRKITIARGKGSVNGVRYDLDSVGIKLRPYRGRRTIVFTQERTSRERPPQKDVQG